MYCLIEYCLTEYCYIMLLHKTTTTYIAMLWTNPVKVFSNDAFSMNYLKC